MATSGEFNLDQFVANLSPEEISRVLANATKKEKAGTTNASENIPNIFGTQLSRRALLGLGGIVALFGAAKIAEKNFDKLSASTSSQIESQTNKPSAQATEPAKTWEPKENSISDDNGILKIEPSGDNWPGMINFFHKDEKTNQWIQHNNIVPVAVNGNGWSNAEAEKAKIRRSVFVDSDGKKKSKYEYPRMKNGAHYFLIASFEPQKNELSLNARLFPDSAPVQQFSLGNFLGIEDGVSEVIMGTKRYDATKYPAPKDGNFIPVPLLEDARVEGNHIEFKGTKWLQFQKVTEAPISKMGLELRRHGWVPWQNSQAEKIGRPWWETVHLFTPGGAPGANLGTWTFGLKPLTSS